MIAAFVQGPLIRLIPVGLVLLALQTTLFVEMQPVRRHRPGDARPRRRGRRRRRAERGAIAGFVLGLMYDLGVGTPLGSSSLTMALAGFVAGWSTSITVDPHVVAGGDLRRARRGGRRSRRAGGAHVHRRGRRLRPAAVHDRPGRRRRRGAAQPAVRAARPGGACASSGPEWKAPADDVSSLVTGHCDPLTGADSRQTGAMAADAGGPARRARPSWRSCSSACSGRGCGSCRRCEADELQQDARPDRRTKTVPLLPERGRIFDADGRILADNQRMLTVAVDWAAMRNDTDRREIFRRLSGWIDVPVEEMERRFHAERLQPVPADAGQGGHQTRRSPSALRERSRTSPACRSSRTGSASTRTRRSPPRPRLHGRDHRARTSTSYLDGGYQRNEIVGKVGVELSMEEVLHGTWGKVVYEVDAANRIVRKVERQAADQRLRHPAVDRPRRAAVRRADPPDPARATAATSPAAQPQRRATRRHRSSTDGRRPGATVPYKAPAGSVVVDEPRERPDRRDGELPDVRQPLVRRRRLRRQVRRDVPERRTRRRRRRRSVDPHQPGDPGQYNLGSTFKLFTAYAALDSGLLGPATTTTTPAATSCESIDPDVCAAGVRCEFSNATCASTQRPCRYGPVNVDEALAVSSDTFFYSIGEQIYLRSRRQV